MRLEQFTNSIAIVIHDTLVIASATEEAEKIFRVDAGGLTGRKIISLIATADFIGLFKLRVKLLKEHGHLPPVRYPFKRDDLTVFWADVQTVKVADQDAEYESRLANIVEDTRLADPTETADIDAEA